MSWKYSVPELPAAWLALAAVRPVAAIAPGHRDHTDPSENLASELHHAPG
jgi:hypothetical protein